MDNHNLINNKRYYILYDYVKYSTIKSSTFIVTVIIIFSHCGYIYNRSENLFLCRNT